MNNKEHTEWRNANKWRVFIYTDNNRIKQMDKNENILKERVVEELQILQDDIIRECFSNSFEIEKYSYNEIRKYLKQFRG